LREAAARKIETEQPFTSVDDLAHRCRLRDDQMTKLAYAGALGSLGLTRRAALWQASKAARPAGELFEGGQIVIPSESEGPGGVGVTKKKPRAPVTPRSLATLGMTSDSPLPEMSPLQETAADYHAMELTTGVHLLEHYRGTLERDNIITAAGLKCIPTGRRVTTAGAVIVRQRPGTAKGFVFLTLEDETGMSQAIVSPPLFREHRSTILGNSGLIVEGILQNTDGQCSIKAERFWPLHGVDGVNSHDFH